MLGQGNRNRVLQVSLFDVIRQGPAMGGKSGGRSSAGQEFGTMSPVGLRNHRANNRVLPNEGDIDRPWGRAGSLPDGRALVGN